VYGLFAFMLSVFERHRETSRPKVEFVRSGERRRGMGEASGVDVCEGILIIVWCDGISLRYWRLE